VTSDFP